MTCPKCGSDDTAEVSTYTRKWTVLITRASRKGDGPVETTREDKTRCLDCGTEWKKEDP